jgi:hypothetical protein
MNGKFERQTKKYGRLYHHHWVQYLLQFPHESPICQAQKNTFQYVENVFYFELACLMLCEICERFISLLLHLI